MNVFTFTGIRWEQIAIGLYNGQVHFSTGRQGREAEGLALYINDQVAIAYASGVDQDEEITLDFGDDWDSALSIQQAHNQIAKPVLRENFVPVVQEAWGYV